MVGTPSVVATGSFLSLRSWLVDSVLSESMMRLHVAICAYHHEDLIGPQIEQWIGRPLVEKVVVYVNALPWQVEHGNSRQIAAMPPRLLFPESDRTAEIVKAHFPVVDVVEYAQDSEHQSRNMIMQLNAESSDLVVIADCDEFYTDADWNQVAYRLSRPRPERLPGYRIRMWSYWMSLNSRVWPQDTWEPVVMADSKRVTFEHRVPMQPMEDFELLNGVTMHHLSWMGPAWRLRRKLIRSNHWSQYAPEWHAFAVNSSLPIPKIQVMWHPLKLMPKSVVMPVPGEIAERVQRWQDKLGYPRFEEE